MRAEGADYRGILYCGLMMTARGPMVLEFNCRFGDPETQPMLMRLESDLLEALEASVEGRVSDGDFKWSADAAACVVIASHGYPGAFEAGKRISGLQEAAAIEGVKVFHAGTSRNDAGFLPVIVGHAHGVESLVAVVRDDDRHADRQAGRRGALAGLVHGEMGRVTDAAGRAAGPWARRGTRACARAASSDA